MTKDKWVRWINHFMMDGWINEYKDERMNELDKLVIAWKDEWINEVIDE